MRGSARRPTISRAAVGLVAVVIAACGGSDADPGRASDDRRLADAAQASLDSESFVISISSFDPEFAEAGAVVTYQAPDRARLRSDGGSDTIVIGRDIYFDVPSFDGVVTTGDELPVGTPDGRFVHDELPSGDYIDGNVMLPLRLLLDAEVISADDDEYEIRVGEGVGSATVREGLIARVTLPFEAGGTTTEVTYEFSDYDAAPAVEPPDASLVDEAPTPPECGEDGLDDGQIFCVDTTEG